MNSREKGKRGERLWRDELRAAGFTARRGQQFSGSAESPDVICAELGWIHFEVKCVERLNIEQAMEQARTECHLSPALSPKGGEGGGQSTKKVPVVAHKRCRRPWLVTMEADVFFRLVRNHEWTRMDTKPESGLPKALSEIAPHLSTLGITPEAWVGEATEERRSRSEPPHPTRNFGGGVCRGQQQQSKTTTNKVKL